MAFSLRLDSVQLTELASRMGDSFMGKFFQKLFTDYAPHLSRKLKEISPGRRRGRTGQYKRGWRVMAQRGRLIVMNLAPHSGFLHTGTGSHGPEGMPYLIVPVKKQALAWRTGGRGAISAARAGAARGGQNFIVRKSVLHPGIRPQPHVRQAFNATASILLRFAHEDAEKELTRRGR
jgi:hypothetical protein